jgi:nitrous oxidase accessory protein NosD
VAEPKKEDEEKNRAAASPNRILVYFEYGINNGQYSAHNLIYHNSFIDDGDQETTYTEETNRWGWDNEFLSGGNYWSYYDGHDYIEDGIGDTPYIIDENNQDNYPLMNPAEINRSKV